MTMGWARDADHENTLDWAVNEATTVHTTFHSLILIPILDPED